MEAKFRGKRIGNGDWIYGYYIKDSNDSSAYILAVDLELDGIDNDSGCGILICNEFIHEVHPDSVGMFTGETVTNGEVFTGDRMVDECDNYLGVVKFGKLPLCKSGDCVCTYPAYYIDCQDSSYPEDCCQIGEWMKIIGNTTDAQNLLKET